MSGVLTDNVVQFPARTYTARLFMACEFKVSGTLDGYIDFAVPNGKTFPLSPDEVVMLVTALNGALEDVRANCLYDRDVFLAST